MNYAWIITDDYIDTDAVGVHGPRDITDQQLADLRCGVGHEFRLYDDDGEFYYAGLIVFDVFVTADDLPEEAFGPLNDFGTPSAGCTEIRYYNNGWKTL